MCIFFLCCVNMDFLGLQISVLLLQYKRWISLRYLWLKKMATDSTLADLVNVLNVQINTIQYYLGNTVLTV